MKLVYIPQAGFHIEINYNVKDRTFKCYYENNLQATGKVNTSDVSFNSLAGFCSMHSKGLSAYIQGAADVVASVEYYGLAYISK